MPRVILQPAGGRDAARHFENTIRTSISLEDIGEFLQNEDVAGLAAAHPQGDLRAWGVTPGAANRNVAAHFGHRDHSDRSIVISEIGGS